MKTYLKIDRCEINRFIDLSSKHFSTHLGVTFIGASDHYYYYILLISFEELFLNCIKSGVFGFEQVSTEREVLICEKNGYNLTT